MRIIPSFILLFVISSVSFAGEIVINDTNKNEVIGTWKGDREGSSSTAMRSNMPGSKQLMGTILIFTKLENDKFIGTATLENKYMTGRSTAPSEFDIIAIVSDKGCLEVERGQGVWSTLCMSESKGKKFLKGTYRLNWEGTIELEKQ